MKAKQNSGGAAYRTNFSGTGYKISGQFAHIDHIKTHTKIGIFKMLQKNKSDIMVITHPTLLSKISNQHNYKSQYGPLQCGFQAEIYI